MERRGSHSRGERKPIGPRFRTRAAQAVRAGLAMAEMVTMTPRVAAPTTAPEVFAASPSPTIVQHEPVSPDTRSGVDFAARTATIVRPPSNAQEASPATAAPQPITARLTAETQAIATDTPRPTRAQLTEETQTTVARSASGKTTDTVTTYEVKKGDSYWDIAKDRLKSFLHKKPTTPQINQGMHELIGLNKGKNPNLLKIKQKINVFSPTVMGAASVVDGIKLPQGAPTQATTLQLDLHHANEYKKGTSVASPQVRKDDKRLADTMQDVIAAAQQKKSAIAQLLQSQNISLSRFVPHAADRQTVTTTLAADIHKTPSRISTGRPTFVNVTPDVATTLTASAQRVALDSLTTSTTSAGETIYSSRATYPIAPAVNPTPISLTEQISVVGPDNYQPKKEIGPLLPTVIDSKATLGTYSSIWTKLAAQEVAGRKLTTSELNFVSQLTRAMNAYGADRTLSSDTQYNGFTDQATLILAVFSHITNKDLAAMGANLPQSVADAISPLRSLTDVDARSASLPDRQVWELNSQAMTSVVNLLSRIAPALGPGELSILNQAMSNPSTAPKEVLLLLSSQKIINALNSPTAPRVLTTTV